MVDVDAAWDRLAGERVAVLGTVGKDGRPHLVPFTFATVSRLVLLSAVDAKPKRSRSLRRLENLHHDPRVTVLTHHYDDDWSKLWWVRATGEARVSPEAPEGWTRILIDRYPDYAHQDLGPWITIELDHITGWEAG